MIYIFFLAVHVAGALILRGPDTSDASPLRSLNVSRTSNANEHTHTVNALPYQAEELRVAWMQRAKADLQFNTPITKHPSKTVVLMLPCKRTDGSFRQVVRDTWMNQVGVCNANQGIRSPCAVYVVFSYQDPYQSAEKPSDCVQMNDCIAVNTMQGWDHLKETIIAMYRTALQLWPWATHIAKMDMDTFPHLQKLIPSVPDGTFSLIGDMVDFELCAGNWCNHHSQCGWCPPPGCGKPVNGNFLEFHSPPHNASAVPKAAHCWVFPQGGLYMLSRSLADAIFGVTGPAQKHAGSCGNDDDMVGWSAAVYAWSSGTLISTWPENILANTHALFEHVYFRNPHG